MLALLHVERIQRRLGKRHELGDERRLVGKRFGDGGHVAFPDAYEVAQEPVFRLPADAHAVGGKIKLFRSRIFRLRKGVQDDARALFQAFGAVLVHDPADRKPPGDDGVGRFDGAVEEARVNGAQQHVCHAYFQFAFLRLGRELRFAGKFFGGREFPYVHAGVLLGPAARIAAAALSVL